MGLAKVVATHFPDWGPEFVFLMVSSPTEHCLSCTVCMAWRCHSQLSLRRAAWVTRQGRHNLRP